MLKEIFTIRYFSYALLYVRFPSDSENITGILYHIFH